MFSTITNRINLFSQNLIGYFRPNGSNANQENSRTTPTCYRYLPNSDQRYFAENFILGSEKFETLQPETFLFADNADINFLNPEPLQVPFNLSMECSPVYPIRSLVHVRRDTIRLVRNPSAQTSYRIEFFFDCDCPVEITVRCLAKESFIGNSGGQLCLLNYTPVNEQFSTVSPSYRFPSGGAQLFSKSDWSFTPSDWPADSWVLAADPNSTALSVPIVVRCRTVTPSDNQNRGQQQQQTAQQEHIILIGLEKSSTGDGSFHLKTVRQKLVEQGCGCVFLLHELYGAENKQINQVTPATSTTVAPATTAANSESVPAVVKTEEEGSTNSNAQDGISGESNLPADTANAVTQVVPAAQAIPAPAPIDDNASDLDDSAGECVVCMSSERDTVLLPCRHLCVCATCAESLRSQCADCPICRLPFKALLRLRAVRPADPATAAAASSLLLSTTGIDPSFALSSPTVMLGHGGNILNHNNGNNQNAGTSGAVDAVGENTPPGYQSVSLMEALYGAYAANWRKSRPSTSVPPLAIGSRADTSSPLATQSMATPKPTRQTPIFGRQLSVGPTPDDGIGNNNCSSVNLGYSDDTNSLS